MNSMEKILKKIGTSYSKPILSCNIEAESIREIRFNAGHKIEIVTWNKSVFVGKPISLQEINEIFAALCEYSVHTYKNEICEGFITSEGGCRIGICGTAVYEKDKIIAIKDICALNIRIPHEVFGAADCLMPYIKGGILIIGPPCSGKTTVLRDISKQKSTGYHVVIVDERFEIAGTYRGEHGFNIGNSVVLSGFIKSDGMKIAVRAMAPDIIICDEFGDEEDISSAVFAMKSGVFVIASMHAFDKNDVLQKPFFQKLLATGIFKHFAFLNKNCEIYEILKAEEMVI